MYVLRARLGPTHQERLIAARARVRQITRLNTLPERCFFSKERERGAAAVVAAAVAATCILAFSSSSSSPLLSRVRLFYLYNTLFPFSPGRITTILAFFLLLSRLLRFAARRFFLSLSPRSVSLPRQVSPLIGFIYILTLCLSPPCSRV